MASVVRLIEIDVMLDAGVVIVGAGQEQTAPQGHSQAPLKYDPVQVLEIVPLVLRKVREALVVITDIEEAVVEITAVDVLAAEVSEVAEVVTTGAVEVVTTEVWIEDVKTEAVPDVATWVIELLTEPASVVVVAAVETVLAEVEAVDA